MDKPETTMIGDFIQDDQVNFEGALTFNVKAAYIEKKTIWKSKNITAEFLGRFWENMLENEAIKESLHFVCAELMENAVYHSLAADYMVKIQLCFSQNELLVYVKNAADTSKMTEFENFVRSLLETENLQKLFVKRMKEARKSKSKKSQLGLITILKDRGAKLAWLLERRGDITEVTTLARILIKGKDE